MSAFLKPLKWYRKLIDRKGRQEAGAFIVEGEKAIRQIITGHPEAIQEILSVDNPQPVFKEYQFRHVTESQFHYISTTQTPQGTLAVVNLPEDVYTDRLPADTGENVLLLEDIQDPGNTGTLIRTAAALDFSGLILTEKGADPFSPKCVLATAGSILSVWLRRTNNYLVMVRELKNHGYNIIAADTRGDIGPEVLRQLGKMIIGLGNEVTGLSEAFLDSTDYRFRIFTDKHKAESLNVATAGAILMYLASRNS
jgi:TrmH family RNA methyltransferase